VFFPIPRRSIALTFVVASAALCACQGGATIGPSLTPTPAPSATVPVGTPTIITAPTRGAASPTPMGSATPVPSATPSPTAAPSTASTTLPAGEKIYVANHGKDTAGYNPSITIYSATATGNVAPLATLAGSYTGLRQVQFPAVDTAGNLYVSDQGTGGTATSGFVNVFAPTKQSGNQPPIETFGGLYNPEGIAFDSSGDVYVMTTSTINIYPPGMTKMMAQITGLFEDYGIFIDAKNNLYVAESDAVAVYAPGATGNATPVQEFDTPNDPASGISSCLSIAADSTGRIYCANFQNNTIARWPAGANGMTAVATPATDPTLTAIDEPYGIFIDSNDIIYIANYGNNSIAYASTTGFAAFAATATVITGSNTGLNFPYGIYAR
jgi:hypothetical protein